MQDKLGKADICLFLEGTYPYVSGGVSTWTHELIKTHNDKSFHLVACLPPGGDTTIKYEIPSNVKSISNIFLQELPEGVGKFNKKEMDAFFQKIEMPLLNLQTKPHLDELQKIFDILHSVGKPVGSKLLLNSEAVWRMLLRMYNTTLGNTCFLDFFWSWRALLGGLYSILLSPIPEANVYHSLCTGYAGLLLARAHMETGRPCIITEHGIYTNERRVEIASARWLDDQKAMDLNVNKKMTEKTLRDFWNDTFVGYSRMAYEAADVIITLFEGNQRLQLLDGASPDRMHVVANGIDIDKFIKIERKEGHPPTLALIGRVVPIKDIKTFIRACGLLQKSIPDLRAWIMGPTDEDIEYYKECAEIVDHLGLNNTVIFTGKVDITHYLGEVDVIALSSISESMPYVILEAGCIGIPTVATNVGACDEMIMGMKSEKPALGQGGAIAELANPKSIADEVLRLLTEKPYYESCSKAIKERVARYYNKSFQKEAYHQLYSTLVRLGQHQEQIERVHGRDWVRSTQAI
ncbi:MAG: GT4 family glycosyltransferase PelF [Alphaproteobacteria bacterium]|nr:GT4 family glycosyltransferase PelF [Alphaproteobacteria bacterium]